MRRIEDYLLQHATTAGDRLAVVCGSEHITYARLCTLAQERARTLAGCGQKGLVLRSSQSIDFLVTYFAAHMADRAIVPLEKDIPEIRFSEIESVVAGNPIPDDIADILFTTGTTGNQKGVMLSHTAILANAENLIGAQGFDQDVTFVISGPLNHIGSLSKIWPMIVVGGTILITEGIKNINAFFSALDYPCRKFATFLVPASLRILMQFGKNKLHEYASKIDFIETGAAPMAQSDMEQLCGILPSTRLYNTYASTETGIISTHDYCHDGCIPGCLGKPMRHASVVITPEGTIACRGPMLMSGYLGDPSLTGTVLRDHTLYTSDLGYVDEQGRLRLEGRAGDVINVGGYKISPIEVENVAMAYPDITDCICVCADHPVVGNVLKLIYVTQAGRPLDQKALVKYLKTRLESYKIPFLYAQADRVERTYNGKINRKFYKNK